MNAQVTLLGFLNLQPNYGYELKRLYDLFFGQEKPILTGQIYSTLARLKRDAKVTEIESNEASAGPDRVKYQITPKGSEYFQAWLKEPEKVNPYLQTTMYYKVVLALLNDANPNEFLDTQRHAHIARMRELTHRRNETADLATTLLIDNTIYHIEADLRWIELAHNRINSLKEEICQTKPLAKTM